MRSITSVMRRTAKIALVTGLILAAMTSASSPADASVTVRPAAVLVSPTSSKVTVLVGGLRKDITLQPTAQVIAIDDGSAANTAFLYNPGPGVDGLLKYSAAGSTITTTFTPMPVNGRYRPFAYGHGIFWYAPGAGADSIWTFNTSSTSYTSRPANVGGDYIPVWWSSRQCCDSTTTTKALIWYAPGTAKDYLWIFDQPGGGHSTRPLSINGRYRPLRGHFLVDGTYDPTDILWYSQEGAEYVWSVQGEPWDISSTRVGDIGPGARPVVGQYVPTNLGVASDTVLWYFPGAKAETYWTQGNQKMAAKPAGNIIGSYRPLAYGSNDILLLSSGTTGKRTHLTADGPGASTGLAGLPADPRGVSGYLLART